MLPFRKKKRQPDGQGTPASHRQAAALAFAIRRRQQQAARLLSDRYNRLPLWLRKACLLCFCIGMAWTNGRLLVQGAFPQAPQPQASQASPIPDAKPALAPRQGPGADSLRHAPASRYP